MELSVVRGYVSATVAAKLMGVSRQRVNQLLKAGRLAGAILVDQGRGRRELWCVPRRAINEYNNRKESHEEKQAARF